MVRRGRKTPSESAFSDKYEFVELATNWQTDAITVLLNLIWQGYDLCQVDVLSKINLPQADDQLERDITQCLSLYVEQVKPDFAPFFIRSEWFEMETREPSPARPKQYDLVFVWSNPINPRIVWPVEAKVLRSDASVTEYVKEITRNYLTCRYAPLSSEGGMLGYLLKGTPEIAFENIAKAVPCVLSDHPNFSERHHKTSDHQRTVPKDKTYPAKFCCHLLLQLTQKASRIAAP